MDHVIRRANEITVQTHLRIQSPAQVMTVYVCPPTSLPTHDHDRLQY
jgi:hypothetical protein